MPRTTLVRKLIIRPTGGTSFFGGMGHALGQISQSGAPAGIRGAGPSVRAGRVRVEGASSSQFRKLSLEQGRRLAGFNGWSVEYGVFEDGRLVAGSRLSPAQLMAIQEFGAAIKVTEKMRRFFVAKFGVQLRRNKHFIRIPPRRPMLITYERTFQTLDEMIEAAIVRVLEGKSTPRKELDRIGEFLAQALRETILRGLEPPLVLRRGTPLYDPQGQNAIFRHIDYRVVRS